MTKFYSKRPNEIRWVAAAAFLFSAGVEGEPFIQPRMDLIVIRTDPKTSMGTLESEW